MKKTPEIVTEKTVPNRRICTLSGQEKDIDILAIAKETITAAETAIENIREDLDKKVCNFRLGQEVEGMFTKTVQVLGHKANAVYTFKDSYARIDTSVEQDLKKLLGSHYDELFVRKHEVSVKPNCYGKLLELAKKHGFTDLLEEDEYLSPVEDFRRKRYEMRTELNRTQNRSLDDVVRQVQSRPSLSFK